MCSCLSSLVGQYTLTCVNGKTPEMPGPVVLRLDANPDDGKQLYLETKVTNTMSGPISLEDGKLKGFLMSTRMMGAPAQMTVERLLGSGLMEGMEYTLKGKVLTMKGKTGSLEWTAM
ncbi:META domain containing protein putative (META1) [Leptomonas seymouri]|uniref:META domain containing protein putative (META1) n=1 Tax=Leptomonas seymouri TaxID=5684 RepID=A0A0N1PC21_LEPSE|nr:META domain containing protein putative (META1) [Leptomonas seymouri]|eukprot:KPI86608.1 META domain containing protein putative (META1) [Leptomonas seymouri]